MFLIWAGEGCVFRIQLSRTFMWLWLIAKRLVFVNQINLYTVLYTCSVIYTCSRDFENSGLTRNPTLNFVMTGCNTLSIDLNKPTGEQAIMSSQFTWQKNSEIYEMIICSCSLSYLYPQFKAV